MDFRNLNQAYTKDEFLLPSMDLLIDYAVGNTMFSFMDGFNGYNQIQMALGVAEKTACRIPIGNFYYTVMPFGLKKHRPNISAYYDHHIPQHDAFEMKDYVDNIMVKSRK